MANVPLPPHLPSVDARQVRAYLESLRGQSIQNIWVSIAGDSGATSADSPTDTLSIIGASGVTTSVSGDAVTITLDSSDEIDFSDNDSLKIPTSATPVVDSAGEIALDTSVTGHTGLVKYFDGVEELTLIAVPTANLGSTEGQVVKYDATNDEFTMGLPGWQLLESTTASSSSSVSFTDLSSSYSAYCVTFEDISPATDGQVMHLRTDSDNGASYDSGASDYMWSSTTNGTTTTDAADSEIQIATAGVGNASNETLSGKVFIHSPSTSAYTKCNWDVVYATGAPTWHFETGGGVRLDSTAVDALEFTFASGNISSGVFRLYGLGSS